MKIINFSLPYQFCNGILSQDPKGGVVLTILCCSALACFTCPRIAITFLCCSGWFVWSSSRRRGGFRTRSPLAVIGRTDVTRSSKERPPGALFTSEDTRPESLISVMISWFVLCSCLPRTSLGAGRSLVAMVSFLVTFADVTLNQIRKNESLNFDSFFLSLLY